MSIMLTSSMALLHVGIYILVWNVEAYSWSPSCHQYRWPRRTLHDTRRSGPSKRRGATRGHSITDSSDWATASGKADVSGDISFLRKRTQDILRITAPNLHLDVTPTSARTPIPLLSSRGMRADRKTFHWLIDAWSSSGEIDAPEKAHALLERMEDLTWPLLRRDHAQDDASDKEHLMEGAIHGSFQPYIQSYHKVLATYARSGRTDAGIRAETLLHHMMTASQDTGIQDEHGVGIPHPNAQTFTHVMEAYVNSGTFNAAHKAQELYNQLEQDYVSSLGLGLAEQSTKPGTIREPSSTFDHGNSHETMEEIHPLRPTARLYNTLINAWAKSTEPNAALMAQQCLDRMEQLQQVVGGHPTLLPTTFHYNSVIHAWANCRPHSHIEDTSLLEKIEPLSQDSTTRIKEENEPNPLIIPAQRAEDILERMEISFQRGNLDARPNTISYNACIDAWAKSGQDKAAQRAEALLHRMEELYQSKENIQVKPNTSSFNAVMNAHVKSRQTHAPRDVERLLDRMESLYHGGNRDVKPDIISFTTVINAWAKSFSYGKADRVLNIYRHMNDLFLQGDVSLRPNVVIFNAVINACAYTMGDIPEQRRAIEIAQFMLSELEKSPHGKPDQVTYGTFLKVCQNQMPRSDSRRRIVDLVFRKCCKDGQVGNLVLSQLKSIVHDESHYRDLVGRSIEEDIQTQDLPKEWSCNVIEGKRRRRQILLRSSIK